jgi:hypothetical protein
VSRVIQKPHKIGVKQSVKIIIIFRSISNCPGMFSSDWSLRAAEGCIMYQSNQTVLTQSFPLVAAPFSLGLFPSGHLPLQAAASIFILDNFQIHVLASLVEIVMALCI